MYLIEFEDNYPLTKNVAVLSGANMIIIKSVKEGEYFILTKGENNTIRVDSDEKLIVFVEKAYEQMDYEKTSNKEFPEKMSEINFN